MGFGVLFLLVMWKLTLASENGPLPFRDGAFIDNMKRKKELENYESCFRRALEKFDHLPECDELSEHSRRSLCVYTSICHLQTSGRPFLDCQGYFESEESLLHCTRDMSNEQFAIYSEHLLHLDSLCYYLKSKIWNEKKQELIEQLAAHSAEVLSSILFVTENTRVIADLQQASMASVSMMREEILTVGGVTDTILHNAQALQDTQLVMQDFFDGNLSYLLELMENILHYTKATIRLQRLLSTSLDWYLSISKLLPGVLLTFVLSCGGLFKSKHACFTMLVFATILSLYIFTSYRTLDLDLIPMDNLEARSSDGTPDPYTFQPSTQEYKDRMSGAPDYTQKSGYHDQALSSPSQVTRQSVVYLLGFVRIFGVAGNYLGRSVLYSLFDGGDVILPPCEDSVQDASYYANIHTFQTDHVDITIPNSNNGILSGIDSKPSQHTFRSRHVADGSDTREVPLSDSHAPVTEDDTSLHGRISTLSSYILSFPETIQQLRQGIHGHSQRLVDVGRSISDRLTGLSRNMRVYNPETNSHEFQQGIRHIVYAYYATLVLLLIYKPVKSIFSLTQSMVRTAYSFVSRAVSVPGFTVADRSHNGTPSLVAMRDEELPLLMDTRFTSPKDVVNGTSVAYGISTPGAPALSQSMAARDEYFTDPKAVAKNAVSNREEVSSFRQNERETRVWTPTRHNENTPHRTSMRLFPTPLQSFVRLDPHASGTTRSPTGYSSEFLQKLNRVASELNDLVAWQESGTPVTRSTFETRSTTVMEPLDTEDPCVQEKSRSVDADKELDGGRTGALSISSKARTGNLRKRGRDDEENSTDTVDMGTDGGTGAVEGSSDTDEDTTTSREAKKPRVATTVEISLASVDAEGSEYTSSLSPSSSASSRVSDISDVADRKGTRKRPRPTVSGKPHRTKRKRIARP